MNDHYFWKGDKEMYKKLGFFILLKCSLNLVLRDLPVCQTFTFDVFIYTSFFNVH